MLDQHDLQIKTSANISRCQGRHITTTQVEAVKFRKVIQHSLIINERIDRTAIH